MATDEVDKCSEYGSSSEPIDQLADQGKDETAMSPLQPELDPVFLEKAEVVQQERLRFDTEFLELQNPESSSGRLLYVFVSRELRRFHLDSNYREAFILNEAYIRAIQRIATGEVIRIPSAWLRSTAFNIIRELSREHQNAVSKSTPLEEDSPEAQQPTASPEDLEDDFATLRIAFQMLAPRDQRLLNLKVVEEHSWREIREILKLEWGKDYTEAALRKRKERALIRLRKRYHAIKSPELME